jgi:hypothetical protein
LARYIKPYVEEILGDYLRFLERLIHYCSEFLLENDFAEGM